MRYLKSIFESNENQLKTSLDEIKDGVKTIMELIKEYPVDEKLNLLIKIRDEFKSHLRVIDSQISTDTKNKIASLQDPIEKLKTWIKKPLHTPLSVTGSKSNFIPGFLKKNNLDIRDFFDSRYQKLSVIQILTDHFADYDGNFHLNRVSPGGYVLTEKLTNDIISENVDQFTVDW